MFEFQPRVPGFNSFTRPKIKNCLLGIFSRMGIIRVPYTTAVFPRRVGTVETDKHSSLGECVPDALVESDTQCARRN